MSNPPAIPEKSKKLYNNAYERFTSWAKEANVDTTSEDAVLLYLKSMSNQYKSSTLWSNYSMLKAELYTRCNLNVEKFKTVTDFLKKQSEGYQPKKSKVFTKEQFDCFMSTAPNMFYLGSKIILLFGVAGACGCDELVKFTLDNIEDLNTHLLVKIPNLDKKKSRSFTINGDNYVMLYREYLSLRPKDFTSNRLFIKYEKGRCTKQVIGIHKLATVAKEVATFLKLPNASDYTGHSFRGTAKSLLLGNDTTRKIMNITDGYIEESAITADNKENSAEFEDIEMTENEESEVPVKVELVDELLIEDCETECLEFAEFLKTQIGDLDAQERQNFIERLKNYVTQELHVKKEIIS